MNEIIWAVMIFILYGAACLGIGYGVGQWKGFNKGVADTRSYYKSLEAWRKEMKRVDGCLRVVEKEIR